MIPVSTFSGKTVAVFGLARSGLAAVKALRAGGARAVCWDDKPAAREQALALGGEVMALSDMSWDGIDALVLSPGIPLTHPAPHPAVLAAQAAGVEVIGDTELFFRELAQFGPGRPKVVAVTGTNGKSTTTALIGHLLSRAGYDVDVGGNIGRPVLDLPPLQAGRVYVLELSSFQLDLTPSCAPAVAVLLNITPDHLDRHGSMDRYAAAKASIFKNQGRSDLAVIGVDDPYCADLCTRTLSRAVQHVCPVSSGKVLGRGVYAIEGRLFDGEGTATREICDLRQAPNLPGAHNWQNAAAAYSAVTPFLREPREAAQGLLTFPGLAHRMEQVGRIGRVMVVNDSKATNADAAAKALGCYQDIYWIAGGKAKDGGAQGLEAFAKHIAKAYLIGDAASLFARQLSAHMQTSIESTLEAAMRAAVNDALASQASAPVVLLSPACASYDQFRDFEHRGDEFKRLFTLLAEDIRLKGAA